MPTTPYTWPSYRATASLSKAESSFSSAVDGSVSLLDPVLTLHVAGRNTGGQNPRTESRVAGGDYAVGVKGGVCPPPLSPGPAVDGVRGHRRVNGVV